MRLEKLRMENFRGFAELELDFSKAGNLAVMVGANGAGKSSVLDCLGNFLSRFSGFVSDPNGPRPWNHMTKKDIRRPAKEARADVVYRVNDPPLSLTDEDNINVRGLSSLPIELEIQKYAREHLTRLGTDRTVSAPVLCYYQADRGIGLHTPAAAIEGSTPEQARAYHLAFVSGGQGPFQLFLKWFRAEEDIENQARLRTDPSYRSKPLEAVRTAIERFMTSLPGAGTIANLRVEREFIGTDADFDKISYRVSYLIDKGDSTFDIEQLSAGERATLLLVADLTMRLVMANPGLADPLQGSGIVLIDEIESHLHPAWQRAILPGLQRTFPGVQFIVSTHSPQVLGKVARESVFILDNFKLIEAKPHTYGRDSNALLEDVMGVGEAIATSIRRSVRR